MLRICAFLVIGIVLTNCSSMPTARQAPEAVHAAWVQAMRQNDRTTLLDLAADMQFKVAFVDDNLRAFRAQFALDAGDYRRVWQAQSRVCERRGADRLFYAAWLGNVPGAKRMGNE